MSAQNKHFQWELEQLQGLPLDIKIQKTKLRIREWYDHWDGYTYLSFSGGKDSTVLRHIIVEQMHLNIPIVFCDTGLEYPEVREFAIENCTQILRPKLDFRSVIKKYGYPVVSKETSAKIRNIRKYNLSPEYKDELLNGTTHRRGKIPESWKYLIDAPFEISDDCCRMLKKQPFISYAKQRGLHGIVGTMACESFLRKQQWIRSGCNAFDQKYGTSKPMSFWTEQDVLEYLRNYQVPFATVYGEIKEDSATGKLYTAGCQRTGCMFCMFGAHLDGQPNRFQRMAATHPQLYAYCMKSLEDGGLGLAEVLDYLNIPRN